MRSVWVSLIVGIVVLAAVFYVYSTDVTVHKAVILIQYSVSPSGYLASNVDQNFNPFRVVYGAENYSYPGFSVGEIKQYTLHLSLISNATSPHQVRSIQVDTVGFTIIQVRPPTPIAIPAQTQALNIDVLIQCPILGYNGNLEILLVVT